MKVLFITVCFLLSLSTSITAQNLQAGDLLIVGMNSKDPDQFCFLSTRFIPGQKTIYFTDCGWDPLSGFRAGEGLVTYVVPAAGLNAGTWVTYPDDPGFTVQGVSGFFGLSTDGDQLYCFTGSMAQPFFISALNLDGTDWAISATSNQTGAQPPLADSLSPAIPEADNAVWDCNQRSGLSVFQLVGDPVHWIHSDTRQLLPPPCSWLMLGNPSTSIPPDESDETFQLQLSSSSQIFHYPLEEMPIKINLYTLDGRQLYSGEPIQQSTYFYSTTLTPIPFSVYILEIMTRCRVYRTLLYL